jgi:hypothetical protein
MAVQPQEAPDDPLPELAVLEQRDRERDLSAARLARLASCHRACCNPTRLDRLALAIGLTPSGC